MTANQILRNNKNKDQQPASTYRQLRTGVKFDSYDCLALLMYTCSNEQDE